VAHGLVLATVGIAVGVLIGVLLASISQLSLPPQSAPWV
jgi:hypothetical protein